MNTQVQQHPTRLLVPLLIGFAALIGLLAPAARSSAENERDHEVPFLALIGDPADINTVIDPYLTNNEVEFVREHTGSSVLKYLEEYPDNPPLYTQPPPAGTVIRIFRVRLAHDAMNPSVTDVLNNIRGDANGFPEMRYINPDLTWLAYQPDRIVLHGNETEVGIIASQFNLTQLDEYPLDFVPSGDNLLIGVYDTNGQRVSDLVMWINDSGEFPNTRAEPDYFTVAFMGSHVIYGSANAMRPGAPATSTTPTNTVPARGEAVGVYVFDTSPYPGENSFTKIVNGKAISVVHTVDIPPELPTNPFINVAAHGTFVATPITELAPDSDIYLVRALSRDGIGTQSMLLEAMQQSIFHALARQSQWNGVLFNYSLGLEDLYEDSPFTALSRMVKATHELNIIQVAATGNNSAYESMPDPMNYPASDENVIGVTGIAPGNKIACYANKGEVAARGGGVKRGTPDCDMTAMVRACQASFANFCLHGYDPDSPTDYSYGLGTSFAAPQVTGFLAQLVELYTTGTRTTWAAPNDIRGELFNPANAYLEDSEDPPELYNGILGPFPTIPTAVGLTETGTGHSTVMLLLMFAVVALTATTIALRRRSSSVTD